jgi:serine protease
MRAHTLSRWMLAWSLTTSAAVAQTDLSTYQWNLDHTDFSKGVCTTVPDATGQCQRATELPVSGTDMAVRQSDISTTGYRDVLIGLIDTGIDYLHPDLKDRVWTNVGEITGTDSNANGRDDGCEDGIDADANGFADDCHGINTLVPAVNADGSLNPAAGDPMDSALGHGTHMAGNMVGYSADGTGIRGVAGRNGNVRVVTCKAAQLEQALALVPNSSIPAVRETNAQTCVRYFLSLQDRGENVAVINLSGGMSRFINLVVTNALVKPEFLLDTPAMRSLLAQLSARDTVLVAAAGNLAWDMDVNPTERAYFPAAFETDNVISVTATDAQGRLWNNATTGRYSVDVAAPGHQILGALPRAEITGDTANSLYTVTSGTSASTAMISGIVALLKANPATAGLSAASVRRLVMAGGRPMASLRDTTLSGRMVRIDDTAGQGVLNCQGQTVQRRVTPRANVVTVLPGNALRLEIESFTCATATTGVITASLNTGATITLADDGVGADRLAGDGIFSAVWQVPAQAADSYTVTWSQGPQMGSDSLTVNTTLIADNLDAGNSNTGTWWQTILRAGFYGANYQVAYVSTKEQSFRWALATPVAGRWEVQVRSPATSGFASNALFSFRDASGTLRQARINQRINGGQWVSVGTFQLAAGAQSFQISNAGADGTVAADAIRLRWRPL